MEKKIYKKRYWNLLLHNVNGKSEIYDKKFFLSEDGRYNSKDELIATIKALYNEKVFDDNSTACRYPARKRWLKEVLDLKNLPIVECKEYDKVFKRVNPTSATLVFPSAHINSPASMFGHTFIRINSSYNSRLLSYAINYAANADPEKENGIVFAIKGLIGGYDGRFSMLPYYDKLKEYRDTENRDIWEYDLNLDKNETIRMFEHIWEIKDAKTSYYFFTQNCSYEMLWLIEIARKKVRLREHFFYEVIPLESVHVIKEENLIKSMSYRPSKRTKILAYKKVLNSKEIKIAKKLAIGEEDSAYLDNFNFDTDTKRYLLEASIELVQYYYQKKTISKEKYLDIFHKLTLNRAKLGKTKKISPIEPPNPIYGHRAIRAYAGIGSIKGNQALFLGIRPAYHDIEDSLYGFLRGTQIEFANLELSLSDKETRFEKAMILSIESIAQIDDFFNNFSWRMNLGWDSDYIDEKSRFNMSVGFGGSIGDKYGYAYLFIDPQVYYADKLISNADVSVGYVLDKYSKKTNLKIEYKRKFYETGYQQNLLSFTQNFRIKQNFSIKAKYFYKEKKSGDENIYSLLFNYYF